MTHLHIPDGVLPLWLWLAGWLATFALINIASRRLTSTEARRSVPLIGVISALMLVTMSTEIVPIAYHMNLTVIAGALLGPWASVIAAFIVVLTLALLGHGGVTVVGLNTLVIATEMVLGWALVRAAARLVSRPRTGVAGGVATVITLAISTTLVVGIVALGGAGATARETGALDPQTLHFGNPFSGKVISVGLFGEHHTHDTGTEAEGSTISAARFAAVVYTLGPIGWLLEALVTSTIIGYVARVRPSLLFGGTQEYPRLPGDEHGRH